MKFTIAHSRIFLICLVIGLGLQSVQAGDGNQRQLPSILVKDLNGKPVNISDYGKDGKITVLNFWATWCVPCKKELNNIHQMYEQWMSDYDMEIVAVSIDDARNKTKVKTYVNGQSWDYTVLLDDNQELKRALNFQTVPYTLLIDQSGNVVYEHSGYVEGDEYELEDKIAGLSK